MPPNGMLRDALTQEGAKRALALSALGNDYTPVASILDEKAFVNGIVGLNATGGSTNLLIHLIAMARAGGIILDWEDFSDISDITPLLARVYPNGLADVNHFHAAALGDEEIAGNLPFEGVQALFEAVDGFGAGQIGIDKDCRIGREVDVIDCIEGLDTGNRGPVGSRDLLP